MSDYKFETKSTYVPTNVKDANEKSVMHSQKENEKSVQEDPYFSVDSKVLTSW